MAILWKNKMGDTTVFENNRKSLIQHGERSERRLRFVADSKMIKMVHFGEFLDILSLWSNSVTRQVNFNLTKIDGKFKIEWTKVNQKSQKWSILTISENLKLVVKQCYQTGHF